MFELLDELIWLDFVENTVQLLKCFHLSSQFVVDHLIQPDHHTCSQISQTFRLNYCQRNYEFKNI
jgi:hypothetical protein